MAERINIDANMLTWAITRALHNIDYLTTADILFEGFSKDLVSETECDTFITKIKKKGSKFRFDTKKDLIAALKQSK